MTSPQTLLRWRNLRRTFQEIRAEEGISRARLAERLGLSAQTIGSVVEDLVDAGLVAEVEAERRPGPGRPAVALRVVPDGAFAFGVGIERDAFAAVLIDQAGRIWEQELIALRGGEAPAAALEQIVSWVDEVRRRPLWASRAGRIVGLGIAAPGPIDRVNGVIVGPASFPGWVGVKVVQELRDALDLPVVLDNAASAAALGVQWSRSDRSRSFLYCYWGLGIGGGLVRAGELYRGATGNAIELGHVIVQPDGHPCGCGAGGCLEAEASVLALLRDARQHGPYSSLSEVVEAAHEHRALADLLSRAARLIADGLLSAANLLDVDEVVLGGPHLQLLEPIVRPTVEMRLTGAAFRRNVLPLRVSVSPAAEQIEAVGAALIVCDALLPVGARELSRLRHRELAIRRAVATAPIGTEEGG